MNKQEEIQYDKAGRLTEEDKQMMSNPNARLRKGSISEDFSAEVEVRFHTMCAKRLREGLSCCC